MAGVAKAQQRLVIARTFLALGSEMRLNLPVDQDVTDATAGTLLLVSAAVLVGHIEGRPMSVSKLAHYVRLPRTTVLRKLELLIELGLVARHGQTYRLSDERAKTISSEYLRRSAKIIRDAARALHELA